MVDTVETYLTDAACRILRTNYICNVPVVIERLKQTDVSIISFIIFHNKF